MVVSLLLKRFEATFISCARDKFVQDIHSPESVEESLMMKIHNFKGGQRIKLTSREAAALCEILLEVETFTDNRSEAEVMLAQEILDRLELPEGWTDPFEFAKMVALSIPEDSTQTVERPESLFEHTERGIPEYKYHL